jgi:Tol biopolymer transport system component/DNA-binding winged helix-turn-helix (wHTH) protein
VSVQNTSIYRFGAFELDLRSGELRKNGVKFKLQEQPRQVLVHLLQRPGEVVSRDELRSLLWTDDTFVDFEIGLNTAVKRLRETLGDSANNPKFVGTLPRRGYKFIAPVEILFGGNGNPLRAVIEPARPQPKSSIRLAYVAALTLVLVSAGLLWGGLRRLPRVSKAIRITNDAKAKKSTNLFVTDGTRLYFVEGAPWAGGSKITQVSATAGETTQIVTSLKEVLKIYAISQDRSELLLANGVGGGADSETGRPDSAAELWVQPLPVGTPHRVGNVYATDACWTPDGMHILYANGQALMTAEKDGSSPRELAKVPGAVRGLRYSPDGRRIRFYVVRTIESDSSFLWEIDANGEHLHLLLPGWKESQFQCCGNWSPDGNYYYFQAGHGMDQAIWVMPERRSIFAGGPGTPSRLISGPLRLSAPVPSGDGKRLFVIGEEPRVELVRYDSKTRRFDSYLPGISAGPFELSPNHQWIAYVSYPDMSLWRSRGDGSDKMQLTFPPVRAYGPRWSPDGSKIAYMDVQFYRPYKISFLSSSGGAPQSIPSLDPDEVQEDPNWAPDGKSLVFAKSKPSEKGPMAIFRLDLDSGSIRFIPNSDGLFSPRLSPDGRFISAFNNGQSELMLFDTNTTHWSSLAKGEEFGENLWSHDGKYVYIRESSKGSPRLIRVRIKDGLLEDVLSLKDIPQLVDFFTAWIGLTPEGAPVLIRDRSVQEIYALDLQ